MFLVLFDATNEKPAEVIGEIFRLVEDQDKKKTTAKNYLSSCIQALPVYYSHSHLGMGSIPDTKVLAIASHVSYGYVGNTMATFVMQRLGCEVAAINTVHFSNHTGYRQFRGRKTSPDEIKELYDGLKASYLTDFDVLLSGYIPSSEALEVVGNIARDLRYRSTMKPGSFFWILDPVMGDQGRLYVSEELVAGYKSLVREADLILPNQFEIEVLTGIDVTTDDGAAKLDDMVKAIQVIHSDHGVKHVVVTSVRVEGRSGVLCVIGSSAKSNGESRTFIIEVPVLDCFFSGTGDMFAGLMVGRLRQACHEAGILDRHSWTSDDEVRSEDLPLAKATCQVLSSMQMVLEKTLKAKDIEMEQWGQSPGASVGGVEGEGQSDDADGREYLAMTKAAEVRIVKNGEDLVYPEHRYSPKPVNL